MARLLPQAEFAVISNAGHLAPVEKGGKARFAVLEFLMAFATA